MLGQRFGMLVITDQLEKRKQRYIQWVCTCDCGGTRTARITQLRSGIAWNCGCIHKAFGSHLSHKTHGASGTRLYGLWQGMHGRCKHDPNYESRGITVCAEWAKFELFAEWAVSAGYQEARTDLSIDRKDNDGDYNPDNCRWADRVTQNRNRRNNNLVTIAGETLTVAEWAERAGINYTTVLRRVERGVEGLQLLTTRGKGGAKLGGTWTERPAGTVRS